mmetsp:Transcript_14913/g.31230  ORF Transcript_14913/g.31230 Transcript_14913/m.31230 type:complete len:98 (+) Transcript_14913:76-369(+)
MMDNTGSSIPVMRKPSDAMSAGLNSANLASAAVQRHPIDRMQRGKSHNTLPIISSKLVFTLQSPQLPQLPQPAPPMEPQNPPSTSTLSDASTAPDWP